MNEINSPDKPDVLAPEPHPVLAGNHSDDDGQAIDEWFENPSHEPVKYDDMVREVKPVIKAATRILSRSVTLVNVDGSAGSNPDAIMFFPADINRKELVIRACAESQFGAMPTAPSNVLSIGSDKTDTYNGANLLPDIGAANSTGQDTAQFVEWRSTTHTGAVWVRYADLGLAGGSGITVSAWVVTE